MNDNVEAFKSQIKRKAISLEIGGFRPPENPLASWFGRVNFALPGEGWPHHEGKPMFALAQVNLTEMPFRPPRLEDIDFMTIFIGPDDFPVDTPNGSNWALRAYKKIDRLVPLQIIETNSTIKPFPMRPEVVEEDYPCWEDLPIDCPDEIEDQYNDLFENVPGFKLGGWPSLIQSEISWAPWGRHPIAPEYVFQIGTTEKGNWMWGHNGVGYYGRGSVDGHQDEWALEWQCY